MANVAVKNNGINQETPEVGMSKIVLVKWLVFGLVVFSSADQGGYTWSVMPYPSEPQDTVTSYCVHAFDEHAAVIVGNYGKVITIKDDGAFWTTRNYGGAALYSVNFSDNKNGWAVGDSGTILKTSDAGETWVQQSGTVKSRLRSVSSPDSNCAWAVGDSGIILITTDGGRNWVQQTTVSFDSLHRIDTISSYNFISVSFVNKRKGLACGNSTLENDPSILMTTDGGAHWIEIRKPDTLYSGERFCSLQYFDTNTAWVSTSSRLIKITIAESKIEFQSRIRYGNAFLNSVCFSDSMNGFYLGRNGFAAILRSNKNILDRGKVISSQNRTLYSISSPSETVAWAVGDNGSVYRTINGGDYWAKVHKKGNMPVVNLTSLHFTDERNGWMVGSNGAIFYTNNGGKNWKNAESAELQYISLESVFFSDTLVGWASGRSEFSPWYYPNNPGEFLLKSIDGGKHWIVQSSTPWVNVPESSKVVSAYLNATLSISSYSSRICGYDIATMDEGKNWEINPLRCGGMGPNVHISDFYASTNDAIFAVGLIGGIGVLWISDTKGYGLGQTYAGGNWKIISLGNINENVDSLVDVNPKSITFSDPALGWIVGDNGMIFRSSDSGKTWKRIASPTAVLLKKARFSDSDIGWIYGERKIFLTIDGGETWQDVSTIASSKINSVYFSSPTSGWAVGDSGSILHFERNSDFKYLKVLYPKSGTAFHPGDSVAVRWDGGGITKVSIAISYDSGAHYTTYRTATDNDGEETIRISANAALSNKCKLRISSLDGSIKSESRTFTIGGGSAIALSRLSDLEKLGPIIKGSLIRYALVREAPVTISLLAASGRRTYYRHYPSCAKGEHTERLPLATLNGGYYLVNVQIGGREFSHTMVLCK